MQWQRSSGVLAHPTSLPGRFGIGDFGPGALRLLDFLADARQRHWQVLPLGPTGYGDSPYATLSAFAGNPLLISPERLVEDGLLRVADLESHPAFPSETVDYAAVISWKGTLLRRSFARFQAGPRAAAHDELEAFCAIQNAWLDEYALFIALKSLHGGVAWVEWPPRYARRDPMALTTAREQLADEIAFQRFLQFLFFRQWASIRAAARARAISIIGDLAIFVAHDSADVWAHPALFRLDGAGRPSVVAGVPPDYFSRTGQRWGNPLYRWDVLAEGGYAWWVARVRQAMALYDSIRLDHFRGFESFWEIPGADTTAERGRWVPGPEAALFSAIRAALGDVPFLAEDLGDITEEVRALRRALGFPGMRVLQFGFDADAANEHLPHNYIRDSIVYTGTHDNDTTRGWFAQLSEQERGYVLRYLDCAPGHIVWAMMRAALGSVADLAVIPLQDVLELGSEARMNFPSRPAGNWRWRCTAERLTPARAERLADLTELYGR